MLESILSRFGLTRLDVDSLQEVLASHWKPYLDSLHVCMADATCYESHMRYPTAHTLRKHAQREKKQ